MNFGNCQTPDCEYRTLMGDELCPHCRMLLEHEQASREVFAQVFPWLGEDEPPQDRLEVA